MDTHNRAFCLALISGAACHSEYVGPGDPKAKGKELVDKLPFSKKQSGGTQVPRPHHIQTATGHLSENSRGTDTRVLHRSSCPRHAGVQHTSNMLLHLAYWLLLRPVVAECRWELAYLVRRRVAVARAAPVNTMQCGAGKDVAQMLVLMSVAMPLCA